MFLRSVRTGFLILSLLLIGGLVAMQCPDTLCRACPSDEVVAKRGASVLQAAAPATTSLFDEPAVVTAYAQVLLAMHRVPPGRVALCSRLII